MSEEKIVVVGYPRSGNTWMSRLLGDILNSPVGGGHGAKPLCTEGQNRPGKYPVQQLHLRPDYNHDEDGAYKISVANYNGSPKLVYITRDPRDVAVSVMHYWDRPGIDDALKAIIYGLHPLGVHGTWASHVQDWLDCPLPYILVRYEDLHAAPCAVLQAVLEDLRTLFDENGEEFDYEDSLIEEVVARQEFYSKKEQIHQDGDSRPYGITIQLKHLRKGIVGDWKNYFSVEQEELAREHMGIVAGRMGYDL